MRLLARSTYFYILVIVEVGSQIGLLDQVYGEGSAWFSSRNNTVNVMYDKS